jgi:hypothetical protein
VVLLQFLLSGVVILLSPDLAAVGPQFRLEGVVVLCGDIQCGEALAESFRGVGIGLGAVIVTLFQVEAAPLDTVGGTGAGLLSDEALVGIGVVLLLVLEGGGDLDDPIVIHDEFVE